MLQKSERPVIQLEADAVFQGATLVPEDPNAQKATSSPASANSWQAHCALDCAIWISGSEELRFLDAKVEGESQSRKTTNNFRIELGRVTTAEEKLLKTIFPAIAHREPASRKSTQPAKSTGC